MRSETQKALAKVGEVDMLSHVYLPHFVSAFLVSERILHYLREISQIMTNLFASRLPLPPL